VIRDRKKLARIAPVFAPPICHGNPSERAMKSLWHHLVGTRFPRPKTRFVSLRLESLEDRLVLSFTYHGGPLLSNVTVQGLFLGSDWNNTAPGNPNPASTTYFNNYLKYIVASPFMDMMHQDGYQVNRGTWTSGVVDPVTLTQGNPSVFLDDGTIETDLQQQITAGKLQSPGPNNLYVVFVEDNVPVEFSPGSVNSENYFSGYHAFFPGTDASGNPATINYAVVTVPGGSVGNSSEANTHVTPAQEMTITASHELAEAVTDPQDGASPGWYDDFLNQEICDVVAGQYLFLHNYAVQRVADMNDQAMTPEGAAPIQAATFVLEQGGDLYEHTSAGTTLIASGVAALSNQSIDNYGRAMCDYVDSSGNAWKVEDGFAPSQIWTGGVAQTVASQGTDFVLLTNGQLYQHKYNSYIAQWQTTQVASQVASISGGTDKHGVVCVDYVTTAGAAYEFSDSTGLHLIKASGVASVSAGPIGTAGVLLTTGEADFWQEKNRSLTMLAPSGVSQLTLGTNVGLANYVLVERLDTNGTLWEYKSGIASAPTQINSGVTAISDVRQGVVDAIMSNGTLQEHNDGTNVWTTIDNNTVLGVG
jgi:hypothetical protein